MITGAHTIKCYGWEQHYIDNIKKLRKAQVPFIMGFQWIQFLGISVYQNAGLVVIILIMVGLYQAEQKLDEAISMSLMAMLFYMFIGVNMLFYYGLTTLIAFLAVLKRISSIFALDEFHSDRTIPADKAQTSVSMHECSFTWGFRVAEKKKE